MFSSLTFFIGLRAHHLFNKINLDQKLKTIAINYSFSSFYNKSDNKTNFQLRKMK